MDGRMLWRSTDGGRTWEQFYAKPGSILFHTAFPASGVLDDGYSQYRETPPESGS
jgi:hypothetical protein